LLPYRKLAAKSRKCSTLIHNPSQRYLKFRRTKRSGSKVFGKVQHFFNSFRPQVHNHNHNRNLAPDQLAHAPICHSPVKLPPTPTASLIPAQRHRPGFHPPKNNTSAESAIHPHVPKISTQPSVPEPPKFPSRPQCLLLTFPGGTKTRNHPPVNQRLPQASMSYIYGFPRWSSKST
jgi:hypothetical protein